METASDILILYTYAPIHGASTVKKRVRYNCTQKSKFDS